MKMKRYIYLFLIILFIVSLLYINKEGFTVDLNNVSRVKDCQEVYFILDQLWVFLNKWGGVTLEKPNDDVRKYKNRFKRLVGRDVTLKDINDYSLSMENNKNYIKEWCDIKKCYKLSVSQCNDRYTALKNIAKGHNKERNKEKYKAIMGINPNDFDVENRDVYKYVGCIKP